MRAQVRTHTHTNGTTLATYEHKPKGRKAKQVGRDDSHWLPYPLPSVYNNDVQVLQSFSTRCGHLRASVTISRKCGWGLQGSHMKTKTANTMGHLYMKKFQNGQCKILLLHCDSTNYKD
jgi:hypothetical protein